VLQFFHHFAGISNDPIHLQAGAVSSEKTWFFNEPTSKRKLQKPSGWWWLTYPSEKYESQLGLLFPIYGKIKIVPTTNQV